LLLLSVLSLDLEKPKEEVEAMKKRYMPILLVLALSVFSFSQILNYVPSDFKAVHFVKNLSNFYQSLKSTPTGEFLADSLGLEMMIQGMIESQLLNRNVKPSDFYELVSKEFLFVQLDNQNYCLVVGPSDKAAKLRDAVKAIFEDIFGKKVSVRVQNGYLFLGSTEDAINKSLKGGGNVPNHLKKLDFFSYSRVSVDKYSFVSTTVLRGNAPQMTFETRIEPVGSASADFLKKLGRPKKLPANFLEYGELTMLFNTEDYSGLSNLIRTSLPEIKIEDFLNVKSDAQKIVDGLIREADTPILVSMNLSRAISEAISGATPTSLEVIAKLYLKDKSVIEKILKDVGVSYTKQGDRYLVGDYTMSYSAGLAVFKSSKFSTKSIPFKPSENDVFFMFLDTKALMEALLGSGKDAYVLMRGIYKDNGISLTVNVK